MSVPQVRLFLGAAAIGVALAGWGCCGSRPLAAAEKNILFIITDDESATLGCYGDAVAKTPAIDAIASDGLVFRRAFATTASCSASRSVVMSGLHNHRNGQYGHQHHYHKFASFHHVARLALPRVLSQAGYRTGHIGKYHVAPEAVYHFQTYLEGDRRNPVEMAEQSRAFISDTNDGRPFFLYFATNDPHRGGGRDAGSRRPLKPDLFGNRPHDGAHAGIEEVFYDPARVPVPPFLPDTEETREELAQYYQSCSRIDQGVARLVEILQDAGLDDKTLIVFTSDHGMAFAGAKTTVYEGGLHVPLVVRDPYQSRRGGESMALVSHVDITPTLLDFAGGLDHATNAPREMIDVDALWRDHPEVPRDNRDGDQPFARYHGKSWLRCLSDPAADHHAEVFASHTFHEIQMYYPMRALRDHRYKLIWNIAHPLPYPFASDLWAASSWQAQWRQGLDAPYGQKTVGHYIERPEFEFYDLLHDPHEGTNLAESQEHREILEKYQARLKELQLELEDPWIIKWQYE